MLVKSRGPTNWRTSENISRKMGSEFRRPDANFEREYIAGRNRFITFVIFRKIGGFDDVQPITPIILES